MQKIIEWQTPKLAEQTHSFLPEKYFNARRDAELMETSWV